MVCKAVLFDVIGTTVKEKDPETINNCFLKAFTDNNVIADGDLFKANRGKDKLEVIRLILGNTHEDISLANSIYNSFAKNIENEIENFFPADDAAEIFNYLRQRLIKIGLGSGLSRDLLEKILAHVKWDKSLFDYIGLSSEIGKSRPHPDMIFDFMRAIKITDPSRVLKIGDTVADIQEGKNAKAITVAILAGTQTKEELEKQDPDFIFNNLSEIKYIIDQ
ncbi:MAG: HAD-IA family hydrolase [Ginsengibacter sp.]